ncbi:hypothetical protein SAMN05428961_101665 [Paenibacillus sp. OK060]|nr:hypothetical protein SAMN05428961_101665 [Paenibacillus sp. OK060]
MDLNELKKLADTLDDNGKRELIYFLQSRTSSYHSRLKEWMDRINGVATKYLQNYLAWFRYLDSKYENTASNKKNMLVKLCLFTVTDSAFYLFLLS